MAGRMSRVLSAAICAALLAPAAPVPAQGLVDPMRPATAGPFEADIGAARSSGPVLEQIVLGDGRRFAVISGRKVGVGDKLGDATVVGIGTDQVMLKGGTTPVLRMFPHADRRSAGTAPAPRPRKAEEGS
jgi:MSHA biogenesis protein MshK